MFNHVRLVFVCLVGVFLANLAIGTNVVEGARSRRNKSRDNFVEKAKVKVGAGNYEGARIDMMSALTLDPKNEANLYFASLIDYKVGKSSSAIIKCDKILKNNRARKYRTKALKLKRLAQDNQNTSSNAGRVLRNTSTTMLYSTAMNNQKEFVDSGYSNVVKRVQQARRQSLSPVTHRKIAKATAYDVLTGREALTRPSASTYAKAITVDPSFNSSALDKVIDQATTDTLTDSSNNSDSSDEVTFTDFDIDYDTGNTENTNESMEDHMKPVDTGKTTKPALEASDDGEGFGDFGNFSNDTEETPQKPANAVETPDNTPAKAPAEDGSVADEGFGDFGNFSIDTEQTPEKPAKAVETPDNTPVKAPVTDDSNDDEGFGDFGADSADADETPAKAAAGPAKVPAKAAVKEDVDEGLDGFGDFGDESSEEKEKAESKDDASEGFGDFGDDEADDSGEDADDFGGFDAF